MVPGGEVEWNKCQPNHTRSIHREANVFRFVESFGNLAGEDSIHRADDDKDDGEEECNHVGSIHIRVADEHIILACRMVVLRMRWCNYHPHDVD